MPESDAATPGLPRNHWFIACASSQLGRAPRCVRILDQQLVVFRGRGGLPRVLMDRCPHRQAPLSQGVVRGDAIECAYHGWRFDGTGRCLAIPSLLEGQSIPDGICVPTLPVQEQDSYIWVWLGGGVADNSCLPRIPSFHSTRWNQGSTLIECDAVTAIENFFDPVHTAFLHRFTHPHFFQRLLRGTRATSHELRVTASGLVAFAPPTQSAAEPVPHSLEGVARFDLPNHASLEFSLPWQRHHGHFFYVPEGPTRTRVEWMTTRYAQIGRHIRWRRRNAVLEQDRILLEHIQQRHEHFGRSQERSVEADFITLTLRKILKLAVAGQWDGRSDSVPMRRVVRFRL